MARQFVNTSATLAQQTALGVAAGPAVAPSVAAPPTVFTTPQSLFYQKVIVPAGKKYPFVVKGDYFYVEGLAYATIYSTPYTPKIKADTNGAIFPLTEAYREIKFPEIFNNIEVDNTDSIYDLILTVWIGFGKIRRDAKKDFTSSDFLTAPAGAYAANQVVGDLLIFPGATNPNTQSATLRKVTCTKANAVVLNADFTLWLWGSSTAWNDKTPFVFDTQWQYVAQIRLPAFVTGGAGSVSSVCDVADLNVALRGNARDPNGFIPGTLYGTLVANAAYVATGENIGLDLYLEN